MRKIKIYKSTRKKTVPDDFGTSDWLDEHCWRPDYFPPNEHYAVFEVYCMKDRSYYLVMTGQGIGNGCEITIVKTCMDLIDFLSGYVDIINLKYKEYLIECNEKTF